MTAKSSRGKTTPLREYVTLAMVVAVLIAAVVLVRMHSDELTEFVNDRPVAGVVVYLVLNVLDAVLLPGAALPLIPVAARAWGHVPAGAMTSAGWTLGSLIAFLMARRWGYPVIKRFTSVERVKRFERYIPENLFWSVVVMRVVLPMDVISYALGLFTDMRWRTYMLATALGVAPTAFVLAFLGKLPHAYEFIAFGIGIGAVVYVVLGARRRSGVPPLPGFMKPHGARR